MLKISLIGPESTGKSVLAQALSEYYHSVWVPEYAREYVTLHPSEPTYEDVCAILERDRSDLLFPPPGVPAPPPPSLSAPPTGAPSFVFYDAGLIIDMVWADVVFGRRPDWLTNPMPESLRSDYYLLLSPDIAWVADPARCNGSDEARQHLFDRYLHEVQLLNRPYGIVSGFGSSRTASAISLIDCFLASLSAPSSAQLPPPSVIID